MTILKHIEVTRVALHFEMEITFECIDYNAVIALRNKLNPIKKLKLTEDYPLEDEGMISLVINFESNDFMEILEFQKRMFDLELILYEEFVDNALED